MVDFSNVYTHNLNVNQKRQKSVIVLRQDQEDVLRAARAALKEHQSIIIQCPTGWGKTALATVIAKNATERCNRVIFSVHRKQLLKQTTNTFNLVGLPHGTIASGHPFDRYQYAQVASINTLRNRLDGYPAKLLVVDEAHLAASATWSKVIKHYKDSGAKIIMLTATPQRLDGRPLGALATHIVTGPPVRHLMDIGILSDYRAFAPSRLNLEHLHTRMGDYITSEIEAEMDKASIVGSAIEAWRKFANGKRTICFAVSRAHGKRMLADFNTSGIPAVYMDGDTPDNERQRLIADFADRRAMVLINVALCTEGFDLSAQIGREVPIEAGIFLRPTKSLALAMQMIGRCLRRKSEPAVLLDHVNLMLNHGLPDDVRTWSLDGKAGALKNADRAVSVCCCDKCFAIYRPARACPMCGHVREVDGRKVSEVEGELIEMDIQSLRAHEEKRRRWFEESQCRTLSDWEALAAKRGNKAGWAYHRFKNARRRAG